jgi:hypothetical protein
MKKTISRRRATPTPSAPRTVDGYFANLPEGGRGMLAQLRAAIRSALLQDFTKVISYRMPAFRGEYVLVWYARSPTIAACFPARRSLNS